MSGVEMRQERQQKRVWKPEGRQRKSSKHKEKEKSWDRRRSKHNPSTLLWPALALQSLLTLLLLWRLSNFVSFSPHHASVASTVSSKLLHLQLPLVIIQPFLFWLLAIAIKTLTGTSEPYTFLPRRPLGPAKPRLMCWVTSGSLWHEMWEEMFYSMIAAAEYIYCTCTIISYYGLVVFNIVAGSRPVNWVWSVCTGASAT